MWLWRCDCGSETVADPSHVKSGHTVSCGCRHAEACRKHGHGHDENGKQTKTYKAWVNMKSRADGITRAYKKNYLDRGIKVCSRWRESFGNFLSDMGEVPAGLMLERKDNDGNYEPGNCCWATRDVQNSNKRTTHRVIVDGESMCPSEACKRVGVLYDTAINRVWRGVSPQDALRG